MVNDILGAILDLGITLVPDGKRVRLKVPSGVPRSTIDEISVFREDIIEAYNERAAIREFDGGFSTEEAQRLAIEDLIAMARSGSAKPQANPGASRRP